MKISEKQLQFLMTILNDSLKANVLNFFTFDLENRKMIYEEIMNQQSEELKDVE